MEVNLYYKKISAFSSHFYCIRNFSYCYSLLGREFCRVDHFHPSQTNPDFWYNSPSSVIHLAQSRFEGILRKGLMNNNNLDHLYFGYEAINVHREKDVYTLQLNQTASVSLKPNMRTFPEAIHCTYVIAADGAHSSIREKHAIAMKGEARIQSLLNVHFHCPGFHKLLEKTRLPSMLYFVFNEVSYVVVNLLIIAFSRKEYLIYSIIYFIV